MRKLRPWNTELALASQSVQLHEMLMPTEFPKENGAIKDSSQQSWKGDIIAGVVRRSMLKNRNPKTRISLGGEG